jgi:hypothetical protein
MDIACHDEVRMTRFHVVFFNKLVSTWTHFSEAVDDFLTRGLFFTRYGRRVGLDTGCHVVVVRNLSRGTQEATITFEQALALAERFGTIVDGVVSHEDADDVDALVLAEVVPNPIYDLAHELGILRPL